MRKIKLPTHIKILKSIRHVIARISSLRDHEVVKQSRKGLPRRVLLAMTKLFFWRKFTRRNKLATALVAIVFVLFASLYIYNAIHLSEPEALRAGGLGVPTFSFALLAIINVKNKWFTYLLKSLKDGNYYIGQTDNIEKRFDQHNKGLNISTKSRRPFVLVGFETHESQKEARWAEYQYKHHSDKKKAFIERLVKNES